MSSMLQRGIATAEKKRWSVSCKSLASLASVAEAARGTPDGAGGGAGASAAGAIETSDQKLFHRTIYGRLREGNKRAKRQIRREGTRIPALLEGRGKLPNILLQVPYAPLFTDFRSGLFALQKLGKTKFCGPLYELRLEEGTLDEYGNPLDLSHILFERVRVLPHNILIHRITEKPLGVSLRYSPEEEPVRVRVPVRCINEEKSKGLREGGWLNRLHKYVDVNVAPFTKAPLYVTVDVGALDMKDRRTIGDLEFEGKNAGCRTVLPDDVPVTMVSPI